MSYFMAPYPPLFGACVLIQSRTPFTSALAILALDGFLLLLEVVSGKERSKPARYIVSHTLSVLDDTFILTSIQADVLHSYFDPVTHCPTCILRKDGGNINAHAVEPKPRLIVPCLHSYEKLAPAPSLPAPLQFHHPHYTFP